MALRYRYGRSLFQVLRLQPASLRSTSISSWTKSRTGNWERHHEHICNNWNDMFNGSVDGITYIHTTYLDNIENLNEDFILDANKTKERDLTEYEHVFLGKWGTEAEGAL